MARVKPVRHRVGAQDVDVGRQFVVDPAPERLGRQRGRDVEMRDLRQRVDAGIGAARAVQFEVLAAGHRSDGAIDLALNRAGVLLDLPAAVPRAGVLDRQLESGHAPFYRAAALRRLMRERAPAPRGRGHRFARLLTVRPVQN